MNQYPDDQFGFAVSHTTRKPREGEVNGLEYHFTDVDKIKAEIDSGKFIEYAEVHGNYYGTSIAAVKSVQERGQVCILEIDVQGARSVKKSSLNAYYLFIAPPTLEDLEARLRGRGTEKEEDIQKRLGNAAGEMEYGKETGNFDKYVVNGDLATASADLSATVEIWFPHLSAATTVGGNAFVKHCVSAASGCVIS
jgi:guanylate kinase